MDRPNPRALLHLHWTSPWIVDQVVKPQVKTLRLVQTILDRTLKVQAMAQAILDQSAGQNRRSTHAVQVVQDPPSM
jgi:hypothetical protein